MDIKKPIVSKANTFLASFMQAALLPARYLKTHHRTYSYSFSSMAWVRKLSDLKWRTLHFFGYVLVILSFGISHVHANMSEKIEILPTVKAPPLLQVNMERTAQFVVKNLSQKTVTLAMMPQKGLTQDTTGLLACQHTFSLRPGQKCLLNLKITGHQVGQKISFGPLICQATRNGRITQDVSFCTQPTLRDRLNTTIVKAKKAIIEVKPQILNIHAAGIAADKLTVINHSETVTAQNIKAEVPESWDDVSQNADDCVKVKPNETCSLFFTAKRAHSLKTIVISGENTTKVPVKVKVEPHDVKKFGPPAAWIDEFVW